MSAVMLDYVDLIAKLTSEMISPPSTTHGQWYHMNIWLNIDQNHTGWRPTCILKIGQVAAINLQSNK